MITLVRTLPAGDGDIYAVWRDETAEGSYEFAAIHGPDGRACATNMGLRAPRLSQAQIAQANQPPRHPAHDLADKGAAARPELATRMQKAADLVESNQVVLHCEQTAVVNDYRISAETCTCKDFQFGAPDGWCKHRLATRMARALGQAIAPDPEATKEQRSQAQAQANREWHLARQIEGHQRIRRREQQARAQQRQARRQSTADLKQQVLADLGIRSATT